MTKYITYELPQTMGIGAGEIVLTQKMQLQSAHL